MNHHSHHSRSLPRPAQLLSGGFSISNRLHLTTKHQRTLWSRATHFEKILMLALTLVSVLCVVLFLTLGSIVIKQRGQLAQLTNGARGAGSGGATNASAHKPDSSFPNTEAELIPVNSNNTKKYCLTPNCVKVAASVIEAIDVTVDPCDDFYVSVHTHTL